MTRFRPGIRCAVFLVALTACVDGPGAPGHFGEVRVEPSYRARYEPEAIGVTLDSASVVVVRSGTADVLLDGKVPYTGGPLAWIIDLAEDHESLDITVELWSGGERRYSGDTSVVIEADIASPDVHAMAVAYVGPPIVRSVSVTPPAVTLITSGATRQYAAEARDPDGVVISGVTFTWSSSDAAVATIDAASGLATAMNNGTTTIGATTASVTGSVDLTVNLPPPVATVSVTPPTVTVNALGATQPYTAEARDAAGQVVPGATVTWSSDDPAVATIDATTGLASATGHGSTTITARSGSVSGTATLHVNLVATVATVVVTPASVTLTSLGATQQYSAEARDANGNVVPGVTFAWTSTSGAVASIDGTTGLAAATGHGATTITATTGAISGSAALNVNLAATVTTVVVTPASATLFALGATQQYTAEARDANGNVVPGVTFTWTSSDGAVASVDGATGLAAATGHGSTLVTATTGSVSGSVTLAVNLAATVVSVGVTPAAATLTALGATRQYTAVARDANGNAVPGLTFTWASSDLAAATIDPASGLATAVANGPTTITASTNGVQGSATLTVGQVVATIVIDPDSVTLDLHPGLVTGGVMSASVAIPVPAFQLFIAEAHDANGHLIAGVQFMWASTDPAVATVDAAGLATALTSGTTTIKASAGGVTGTARLVVR